MVPEIFVTDENAPLFDLDWLNQCSEEVNFADAGIDKFLAEINKTLAHRLRGEFSNKYRQQAIFELLGQDFTKLHFPHHEYNGTMLRPPNLPPKKREELMAEMRSHLDEQLQESLEELGYPKDISNYKEETKLKEFLDQIREIFKGGCESQVQSKNMKYRIERSNSVEDDVASVVSQASGDEGEEDAPDKLEKLSFQQSDVVGEALNSLTNNDDNAKQSLLESFKKNCLMFPNPLRRSIWEGFISDNDEKDTGKRKSKKKAARDFKAEIKKKLKGGTQRAVQSQDYKKIYSAVIDIYHASTILKTYAEDTHMLQTANIINILNVFDKEYTTAQIYWALPFQILYEKGVESREDEEKNMIEISCLLEKFCRHAPLSFKAVSRAAQKVIEVVRLDEDLFQGITKALDESIHASGMLFYVVPEVLVADHPNKAEKTWADLRKKKKKDWRPKDHELFGKLDLWMRKWISEGFVGILPYPLVFYIWDILFMYHWDQQVFISISVMLMSMIKPWIQQARSHRELVEVLLEEPGRLYIQDIKNALVLLQENGCMESGEVSLEVQNQLTSLNSNYIPPQQQEPQEETTEVDEEKKEEGEEEAQGEGEAGGEEGEKEAEEGEGEPKEEDKEGEGEEDGEEKKEEDDEDKGLLETAIDKAEDLIG